MVFPPPVFKPGLTNWPQSSHRSSTDPWSWGKSLLVYGQSVLVLLGCVLSLSLYTNNCTSKDPVVKILKFADDATVIGLIYDGCKSSSGEVEPLMFW